MGVFGAGLGFDQRICMAVPHANTSGLSRARYVIAGSEHGGLGPAAYGLPAHQSLAVSVDRTLARLFQYLVDPHPESSRQISPRRHLAFRCTSGKLCRTGYTEAGYWGICGGRESTYCGHRAGPWRSLDLTDFSSNGVWYWIILGLVLASTVVFLALPFMGASRGMTLKPMWYGGTFLLNTGYWALTALSFALFMQALPGATSGDAQVSLGGVYIFSWGIGFITPFAPQGIGVSEAVSSQLIHSDLSGGSLFVLVASFRVVVLCGDLSVWLAFWIYWALRSRIQALRRK